LKLSWQWLLSWRIAQAQAVQQASNTSILLRSCRRPRWCSSDAPAAAAVAAANIHLAEQSIQLSIILVHVSASWQLCRRWHTLRVLLLLLPAAAAANTSGSGGSCCCGRSKLLGQGI